MPDYQMVSETLELFNEQVNVLLADGYELYGPPSVISTKKDGETYILYNQALFKP